MSTLHPNVTVVNPPTLTPAARAFRHGEDRAILGLSRENCTNQMQADGWDAMTSQMDAVQASWADGYSDIVERWAAALNRRLDEATQRRAWALAIEAEADAILVDMESPFYSGHEHEMAEVA